MKKIIYPRQARDKHTRESTQKEIYAFSAAGMGYDMSGDGLMDAVDTNFDGRLDKVLL